LKAKSIRSTISRPASPRRSIMCKARVRPAFEGAEDRAILFPLIENLVFDSNGFEYLRDWALPHFYFHVVTAYDILRHNGVEIGKRDYLSHTGIHIHPRA